MQSLFGATLTHRCVRLEPIAERHREGLNAAANSHPDIFRHMPNIALMGSYSGYFDWLLGEQEAGRWLPFAVIAPDERIVGNSCYLDIRPSDHGVEIGGTWYSPIAQGTKINPAAKYLLLEHAFASGAERVALKTDALNERSRAAILKLGASFEGIHRRHMRRANGTWRDTAWYSILREEWPQVRSRLEARLAA